MRHKKSITCDSSRLPDSWKRELKKPQQIWGLVRPGGAEVVRDHRYAVEGRWMTFEEASAIFGVSGQRLHQLVKEGRLIRKKVKSVYDVISVMSELCRRAEKGQLRLDFDK